MSKKFLMVNADDLGLCSGVNSGILETVNNGIVNAVSAFAQPGFEYDSVPFVNAGATLGIHFNLSFGNPVSPPVKVPSLLNGKTFKTSGFELCESSEIRTELLAQYNFFQEKTGFPPLHMNFHKHLNESYPVIQGAALAFAESHSLPMRAKNPTARADILRRGLVTSDFFIGDVSKEPYWTRESLVRELDSMPEGFTELMCHPGKNTGIIDGLWYLEQRDLETAAFKSPEAQIALRESSITLVNYQDFFDEYRSH